MTQSTPNNDHTKEKLLEAMLPHVPFDGWSMKALELAAKERNIALTNSFKNIDEYIDIFMDNINISMCKKLEEMPLDNMRLHEKIEAAIMARFEAALPHRETIRQAISYYALPSHAASGTAQLSKTVDCIWKAVGDHPTDFSYYTKRVSLGAIYSATALFWLGDESDNSEETRQFLRRRMGNLFTFHKGKKAVMDVVSGVFTRFHPS